MKKIIFRLLLVILVFSVFYLSFGLWGIIEINKNNKYLFKNNENLFFHKKYSDEIHHLRDANRWGAVRNEYLFSIINKEESPKKTILFQGDSWIESISEIKSSENLLKEYAVKNKYNIYNAGVTSFSPSLMNKQFQILKKDFDISPEILVVYIDQTDIGDEFCRYKKNKVYSDDGRLLKIEREKFSRATYDYSKLYIYSELNLDTNIIKVLKFPYQKLIYFLKRNYNQISNVFIYGFKNRNQYKCGFKEIMKELINYNSSAEINFKKSLVEFLEFLKTNQKLEKILVVSFPHRNHLNSKYKVNVSKYINDVLNENFDKRINHYDMSILNLNKYNPNNLYKKNDIASHLDDKFHSTIFIKNILSKLDNIK